LDTNVFTIDKRLSIFADKYVSPRERTHRPSGAPESEDEDGTQHPARKEEDNVTTLNKTTQGSSKLHASRCYPIEYLQLINGTQKRRVRCCPTLKKGECVCWLCFDARSKKESALEICE